MRIDQDADFKALAVVGSLFVEQFVSWGGFEGMLSELLEHGFEISLVLPGVGLVKQRAEEFEDEIESGFFTAVNVNGPDNGFDGSGVAGAGKFAGVTHAFADAEELVELDFMSDFGTGSAGDNHAFDFSQFAFEVFGETFKKLVADTHAENGIAEEFKPFVTADPVVSGGGMGKSFFEQIKVFEIVINAFLALFKRRIPSGHDKNQLLQGLAGRGRKGLCRTVSNGRFCRSPFRHGPTVIY